MKASLALSSLVLLLLLPTTSTEAAGWSTPGYVERIEVVKGNGLIVIADFDNVNSCTAATGFWVRFDHPQYDEIYALMLTAITAQLQVQPYFRTCEAVGWHGGTWNVVTGADAVYLLR